MPDLDIEKKLKLDAWYFYLSRLFVAFIFCFFTRKNASVLFTEKSLSYSNDFSEYSYYQIVSRVSSLIFNVYTVFSLMIIYFCLYTANYLEIMQYSYIYDQYNASQVEHDASYLREILLTIFRLVTLNDVSLSFKINGNFWHNHIAIYDFPAT